jgi:hypothetical protein
MSKYIVDMPGGWAPRAHNNCDLCRKGLACKNHFGICPFAKAQEVVEVDAASMQYYGETENGKIHDKDGLPVKLYAAKVEEKNK